MKIVQVMPEFGLAGAETMCENLVYELVKQGHEVTVISMYDFHSSITSRLEDAGADVRYIGKKLGLDLSMIVKIKKILKELNADVVHTHRNCAQYAIPAAIMAGVKNRIHTVHNVAEKENIAFARKVNGFFFRHCHVVPVALSELLRDSIFMEYGIDRELIPVIYNGVDISKCIPKEDYFLDGNFKILHIGRFAEAKNHVGLIDAFEIFHSKHTDSELWLIGDGEERAEIESCVNRKNLNAAVKFLGLQSNVYRFLHDADMFTLPSVYEGMPMTLIEAMGTGLPIVATAVGGVPDMLDQISARLVSLNAEEIAQAFEEYYLDYELRKRNGQNASKAAQRFSAETMAKRYLEIYRVM